MSAELAPGDSVREAIEALALDPRLARIESVLDRFNIFDAVGPRWKETDHSACLAFLLDPAGTHQLGDAVLRTLLGLVAALPATMATPDPVEQGPDPVEPIPDDMASSSVQTEVYHLRWRWVARPHRYSRPRRGKQAGPHHRE